MIVNKIMYHITNSQSFRQSFCFKPLTSFLNMRSTVLVQAFALSVDSMVILRGSSKLVFFLQGGEKDNLTDILSYTVANFHNSYQYEKPSLCNTAG